MLTLFSRHSRSESDSETPEARSDNDIPSATTEKPRGRKPKGEEEPNLTHGWTNGERFKSVAATGLIWAFCGAGVLSLGMNLLENDAEPQSTPVAVQDVSESQRASEFATTFVTRYLTASRDQEEQVSALLARGAAGSLSLPSQPAAIGSVIPGEAIQLPDGNWVVTVAVEQPATEEQPAVWRYWQVTVISDESGSIAAAALPSLVTAPTNGGLTVEKGDEISDPDLESTAGAFVKAYLTGQGEVDPLTAPGSGITAVTPIPYTDASVSSLRTMQELPLSPAEGDLVRTQISVTATAADGTTTQLGYTVDLRFRDRWEISAINPTTNAPTTIEGDQP